MSNFLNPTQPEVGSLDNFTIQSNIPETTVLGRRSSYLFGKAPSLSVTGGPDMSSITSSAGSNLSTLGKVQEPNSSSASNTAQHNSLSASQIAGVVSGGSQTLSGWFNNLNKPIDEQETSDTRYINGFGYTNINDLHSIANSTGNVSSALSGAASGASAGSAFGPIGTGVGTVVGGVGGFVSSLFGNKKRNAQIRQRNIEIGGENDYSRSKAETNYLQQQYTQNSNFAYGGMYLPSIINAMQAKMADKSINMHNLNNFFTGGMFKGTQLDPSKLTGRIERSKFANGGLFNIIPQLANANAWVDKKETIMSQNGNVDSVNEDNPNMMKVHNGQDGYLASLQNGDMILSNSINIPGTNKTFAQQGKTLENLINKSKTNTSNNISENTNTLNAKNAMNKYRELFELQQQMKFNKK